MALFDKNDEGVFLMPGEDVRRPKSMRVLILSGLIITLLVIGFANLYSASSGLPYFTKQLRNLVVIVPAFLLFTFFIPIRKINSYAWAIYGSVVLALIVVIVLGKVAGGAQRWISLGPIGFQPSEFAKLAVAIITAHFFSAQRISVAYKIRDLLPIITTVGLVFVLIFLQPDFGTAGICLMIFLSQLYFVRIHMRSIMLVGILSPVVAVLGWTLALRPYQKMRILNLFDPNLDPQNTGYNSLQSLIAIGSGSAFGKGFMNGTQAQLKFLPERHTDFVFSVFAEEHGFWGGAIVFAMFLSLTYVALDIARQSKDTFCAMLAIGIAAFLFFEFFINIAMVLGIFPVVGLPLPFFSYGSSSLLTVCVALGLLISINRETHGDRDPRRMELANYTKFIGKIRIKPSK